MNRCLLMVLVLGFLLPGWTARANEPDLQVIAPADEAAALRMAELQGRQMMRHDLAASVVTDVMLADRRIRKDKRVRGWITEPVGENVRVTVIDATPAAVYRAMVSTDGRLLGELETLAEPQPLTAFESGAATARATALATAYDHCTPRYNTIVLPAADAGSDSWIVYLLPATTSLKQVPLGGTYRVNVQGARVTSMRTFTRTCIVLENPSWAEALMVGHLLDNVPTEAHVFWSLWAKRNLFVSTPDNRVWGIEGGSIKLVE